MGSYSMDSFKSDQGFQKYERGLKMVYRTGRWIVLFILFISSIQLKAQYLTEQWSFAAFHTPIGLPNICCADLNDDGKQEIVLGHSFGSRITILEYQNGDYVPIWNSRIFNATTLYAASYLNVLDIDNDSENELVIVFENGVIEIYDGKTLEIESSFQQEKFPVKECCISDVDNDGTQEILMFLFYDLLIYDAETFDCEWDSTFNYHSDIKVGDIDGDGENEIVLGAGKVLNGKTHKVEWNSMVAFGEDIELADIDQDGIDEIVGRKDYFNVFAFDGQSHDVLWQLSTEYDMRSLAVTDFENDGILEILLGQQQGGHVECYNAANRELLWKIEGKDNSIPSICTGDPDNDGKQELIWGDGDWSSGPDFLNIADVETQTLEWGSLDLVGPFCVEVDDIDNDGRIDLLAGSNKSDNGYSNGMLFVYDAITHEKKKVLYENDETRGYIDWVKSFNINSTPEKEIFIGANGRISMQSSVDYQQLWYVLNTRYETDPVFGDIENDGSIEMLLGLEDRGIVSYDMSTLTEERILTEDHARVTALKIIDYDDDPAMEIYFSNKGVLYIIDGITRDIQWQGDPAPTRYIQAVDWHDLNCDGVNDFLYVDHEGMFTVLDGTTMELMFEKNINRDKNISAICTGNFDNASGKEIILRGEKLYVLSAFDLSLRWQSESVGGDEYTNLIIKDTDKDDYLDFYMGSPAGFYHFEASSKPDITPPVVESVHPLAGQKNVPINTCININFSERINPFRFEQETVWLMDDKSNTIDFSMTFDDTLNILTIKPDTLLPENNVLIVTVSGEICDYSGLSLDGDYDGTGENAPQDNYIFSFSTGTQIDTLGPVILNVVTNVDTLVHGSDLIVSALACDTLGDIHSGINSVECFIDSFGQGYMFQAIDNAFDSEKESVELVLNNSDLTAGFHELFIHARDQNGNWGNFVTVPIQIVFPTRINTDQQKIIPDQFCLYPNYPNPFNHSTQISFDLPKSSFVNLSIYDINGRLVKTIVNETMPLGNHRFTCGFSPFASGIYFYSLTTGDYKSVNKCVFVK